MEGGGRLCSEGVVEGGTGVIFSGAGDVAVSCAGGVTVSGAGGGALSGTGGEGIEVVGFVSPAISPLSLSTTASDILMTPVASSLTTVIFLVL